MSELPSLPARTDAAHPSPRRAENRREAGIGVLLVLFTVVVLIVSAAISMSLGQAYLARGQLQASADAAALAAIGMVKQDLGEPRGRAEGDAIASQTVALETGVNLAPADITFGDYDAQARRFRPGGIDFAPAAHVIAKRTAGSGGGPINLLMGGLLVPTQTELYSTAVATTGCREIIFAIDASSAMQDERAEAIALAISFTAYMRAFTRAGDKTGMLVYAADGLSLAEYANGPGSLWTRPPPSQLSSTFSDWYDLNAFEQALAAHGDFCDADPRLDKMPTLGRGSCAGKGEHHGIYQAMEMYDELENDGEACSSPGERLLILMTSSNPCAWPGALVGLPGAGIVGGTVQQAYDAADEAEAAGISIVSVLLRRGNAGACTSPLPQTSIPEPVYVRGLQRGRAARYINNPSINQIVATRQRLNRILFVRLVE